MVQGLVPLIVLGLIVYGVVAAIRRREETGSRTGEFSVRRLFIYAMLFVSLVVGGIGLSGVLGTVLSGAGARRDADIAAPLALLVVGVPVFVLLAAWVLRTHRADPAERATAAWALYLNGALLVALGSMIGSAFGLADAVVRGDWDGFAAAGVVVSGTGWAVHWAVWRRLQPARLPRLHLWLGSTAGLWIGGAALGIAIDHVARRWIESGPGEAFTTTPTLRLAGCGVAIGAAVWVWHWLAHGRGAPRSAGWFGYVLFPGVLAGLAAVVAGAGFGLYVVLEWFLGDPEMWVLGERTAATASTHFADLAGAAAAVLVGGAVWSYHRSLLHPRIERTETDRLYDYLVTGLALVTVACGVAILVVGAIEEIAAGDGRSDVSAVLAGVTLLAVGAPLWAVTWRRAQRRAAADEEEVRSITRRIYLFGIFGVGGAVAFGAMIALLVVVFRALFENADAGLAASDVKVPVALLVTTGAAAVYHWFVYRAERHLALAGHARDVLIVGDGLDVAQIAQRAHVTVRLLHRTDLPPGAVPDLERVVDAIAHAEGEHLVVLAGPDEVRVVPYR